MLRNIKTIECPICGCTDIIEESVDTNYYGKSEILQHCNGTRWEHRKFLCGYHVQYEPNFSKEAENKFSECKNSPEVIAIKKKEKQDKENLIKLLNENNISESIIEKVERYCL